MRGLLLSSYAAMAQGTPFQGGGATARFSLDTCNATVMGDCAISDCSSTNWVSAGVVTVKTSAGTWQLDPGTNNSYPTQSAQVPLFTAGEMMMFSAPGAMVPAFSGTLIAPGKPTLTSPAAGALTIDRSKDFSFAWSGGGGAEVWITMSATATPTKAISCHFAASAGHGVIPKAVLGALPAGAGSFGLSGFATATKRAGDWDVSLMAFYSGVWPDGTMAAGQTTLQ